MECGSLIGDVDIFLFREQLEQRLSGEIDGIASEGGLMVRYSYIPHSLRLDYLVNHEEIDPLTPYLSIWSYKVIQSASIGEIEECSAEECVSGIRFTAPLVFDSNVEIPIDPSGSLVLDGIDFIQGLETATEGIGS